MKKYLFAFMALLFVGVAYADEVEKTPTPEIYCDYDGQYGYVYVYGEGELTVQINGETITGFSNPFIIDVEPAIGQDQTFDIVATAQLEGYLVSDPAYYTFCIPGIIIEAPMPTFEIVDLEDAVVVSVIGDGDLYITMNGDEVYDNPIVLAKGYDDYSVYVTAVARVPGYLDSEEASITVYVPAMDSPTEQAETPILFPYIVDDYYVEVYIDHSESSVVYWRWRTNPQDGGNWSEWNIYEETLRFTEVGDYQLEAYSTVPGMLDSEHVFFSFSVTPPTPIVNYDFVEDGIYYIITGNEKVSVTRAYDNLAGYEGDIVIPATVVHDGVTYNVVEIGDNAFYGYSGLTSVSIGGYVTKIGNNAFMGCTGLTEVILSDYVISIGDESFSGCSNLGRVIIGHGVRSIGNDAFAECNALTTVICKPAVPPVMAGSNCFSCYQTATLHVFPAVLDSYQTTDYWNLFSNIVGEDTVNPMPNDVNGDGKVAISDVSSLIDLLLSM